MSVVVTTALEGRTIRVGTRASALATTQSSHVASELTQHTGLVTELVTVSTHGDRDQSTPLAQLGGTGVFVTALRESLLAGEVDIAVHSLKDLPTTPDDRLCLAAIPAREDSRDALVARDGLTLGELGVGDRVGTGSPRRAAQLNALGLGFEVVGLRGNVDTRIAKVAHGELDAVVLAYAGLKRLGRQDEVTEVLDPIQLLPAPGQGALAIECRADDTDLIEALRSLDHPDTRAAVTAERTLLSALEAGCSAPVGALAEVVEGDASDEVWLRGIVAAVTGAPSVRLSATGTDPVAVGERLAAEMLTEGAADIVAASA